MERRTLGIEDMIEEINMSVKENVKLKIIPGTKQNTSEIWAIIKNYQ